MLNKYLKIVGGMWIDWSLPHQTDLNISGFKGKIHNRQLSYHKLTTATYCNGGEKKIQYKNADYCNSSQQMFTLLLCELGNVYMTFN